MNKFVLAGAILLSAGLAQASQLHCEGSYYFYHFVADGTTSGNHIVGNINIVVTGGGTNKKIAMAVNSSDVQEGRYIHAAATSSDGSGQLSADYDSNSKTYSGVLSANTSDGSADIDVVCTMNHGLYPEFDMSIEEATARGLYPVEQESAE